MYNLKNEIFIKNLGLNLKLYARYVDDNFVAIDDSALLTQIKTKFEQESVLTFTHEIEKDQQLSIVECHIKRFDDTLQTSVFVKVTKAGDCLIFKKCMPGRVQNWRR